MVIILSKIVLKKVEIALAYIRKKYTIKNDIKAYKFLIDEFNISMGEAQKWIDKKRVYLGGEILNAKNFVLKGKVEVIFFDPQSSGLKPIFETEDFAVFDKPSGVLVHPNKLSCEHSLNDDIKSLFGKDANVVHRIDKETSGLVLVSKYKKSEVKLKKLFEDRRVRKEYLALIDGSINKDLTINAKLKANLSDSLIRIKSHINADGQEAITAIEPLIYLADIDKTIIKAIPKTGRTHQIRVHMFHVKHKIVGDPIYGLNEFDVDKFLCGMMSVKERLELTGANRLMLHADFLSFQYDGKEYNIKSKMNFEELCSEYSSCG